MSVTVERRGLAYALLAWTRRDYSAILVTPEARQSKNMVRPGLDLLLFRTSERQQHRVERKTSGLIPREEIPRTLAWIIAGLNRGCRGLG